MFFVSCFAARTVGHRRISDPSGEESAGPD
jgi:hypothetical protein